MTYDDEIADRWATITMVVGVDTVVVVVVVGCGVRANCAN
jgi:hypothetical protein